MRLAIVATHPIQYHAPWFRHLAARMDIEVLYAHRQDARGQASAGFGVDFEWDTLVLDGYPYRWLNNVARSPRLESFSGCDTPELNKLLRPNQFDACLVLGWNRKCYLQAAFACWRNGLPILMRGDSQLRTPRSRLRRLVKRVPYRLLLPRCAAHLYVGQRNREYLRHYGVPEAKLFFSPHCVDNAFFASEAERARTDGVIAHLRHGLRIGPEDFVALFVGKLIDKKRASDFVRACGMLERTPSGRIVHGVLVGDGPLRHELEHQARPWAHRIHFTGFCNQSQMPAWYAAADVIALPSDGEETWGLVVNEAMACGIPAIVSDAVGCAPDLIDPGCTGYTYPTGSVELLAERIVGLESGLTQRRQDIRRSIERKIQQYSFDGATAGLLEALSQLQKVPHGREVPIA